MAAQCTVPPLKAPIGIGIELSLAIAIASRCESENPRTVELEYQGEQ